MRKKFKSKKKFKLKYIFIPLLIVISMFLLNFLSKSLRTYISNEIIIKTSFKSNNNYAFKGVETESLANSIYYVFKDNIFNNPINLLKNELKYYDKKEEISFVYGKSDEPLIYIYNSHQGETYSIKYLEEHNIIPDVLMASNMLKDKLEDIGIKAIVEENDILEYMKQNNLNHAGSYKASRYFLSNAINNYPNAKLFIDLHRDAATHSRSTTIINDKPCAKVLFVIGLEYETYENNLNIVTEINNIILEKYPSLTRGIMKKQGYGVNGVYNQDLKENVILIEIGGNENNIEEVNNTLDLISIVIGEYLNEKK